MPQKKNPFPSPDSWLAHRVSYGETDKMGWTYYGEYLHYFERARGQFIRERGMSYAEVEKRGAILPVREAWSRYRVPCRYDELIWIRTGISEWSRASLRFVYELYDEERKTLLCEGYTHHACVNADGKPVAVPDWLKKLFLE
jgi:acyl-CoA thioester hydrolase